MGLDSTLDNYLAHTWYPERHERGAIGAWRDRGEPRLSKRLHDEVRSRIASHDYELDTDRHAEIESIYRKAETVIIG